MGAPRIPTLFLQFLLVRFMSFGSHTSFASDFISSDRPLSQDQTITSKGDKFVLDVDSGLIRIYRGNDYCEGCQVWASNSETPVYVAPELRISDDGNLVLLDQSNLQQVWSTNIESTASNSTVAVLLDSGNLVLRDGSDPSKIFWQSCDHPTDTWLPGCYLGFNKVTGENRRLTSSGDESSPGVFSLEVDAGQLLIKSNESKKYWSGGNLTDGVLSSAPNFSRFAEFEYISNETVNYFTYSLRYSQTFGVFRLDNSGVMEQILLADDPVALSPSSDPPDQCGNPAFCVGSAEMKKSNNMSRVVTFVILGSVLGSIVCLVVIFKMVWIWKKRGRMHKMKSDNGTLVALRYRKLKEMTNDFSERLGGGGFGSVFKGMLPDSAIVAVKKLEGVLQGEKQFRSEVSTIGVIQHVNLVRLLGFCSEGTNKLLVYEYMPNGSLDFHLFRNTDTVLDWKMRYKIALGTARGLSYLHEECRDCIIHCDIKPENILLDALFVPKVADFGLAKNVNRNFNSVLTTLRGTIGYLAPEWLSGGSITAKADVYSYGMLLLEIISGRRNTQRSEDGYYFPVLAANKVVEGDVLSILDPRLEGNANLEELDRASRVACWCIQDNEVDRLSMGEVVQILEGVVEVNRPPIPKLLQALAENIESIIYFSDGKEEHFDEDISARPL
ncbi:uncharacterized protein A4U43_C07F12380 [Asparagus officinalis]|uniref:non-specific serine/threonine protein kinase n=1 Tax=Asparagus officinalis TaxID=4686 RepID=A0A5P1EBD4_ASPOF|nr:G-type lectin S-receptor-like serine/threonine-protein kinase At2g19130 [Asparagus officinalis]ONK63195.1 uncharacterized protein A4U43_C07F12380 [Asparagus officinalis]